MARFTKAQVGKVMSKLEKHQTYENAQEAATFLGFPLETDIDGLPLYRGSVYPDRAELIDEILLDLGNKQRSI